MNREGFMREPEYLLQDIPEEDKADALDYHRDYLEEAGDEAETAIQEFGSPERITAVIRSDIIGHLENGGEFTERGYEDECFRDPNYQVVPRYDLPEAGEDGGTGSRGRDDRDYRRGEDDRRRSSPSNTALKVILIDILVVMTSPIWVGLSGGLFGIFVGVIVTAITLLAAAAIVTVALFIAGIAAGVAGAVHMMASPLGGLLTIETGLILTAIPLVCLVLSVQIYSRLLLWMFRGTINVSNGLFHREGRER